MNQKQVVITINRDGTSTIDAQNFAGVGCEKATKALEVALVGVQGGDVDRKKKPDFYQSVNNTNTVKR